MGLREQQDLLARLYTDPDLLQRFFDGPEAVGERFGLAASEIADLRGIAGPEVLWFSDSLFWKRFREVGKLLPVCSSLLGSEFEALFREFSKGSNPGSVKKQLEDALAFAQWLLSESRVTSKTADVVRFESTRLRHNSQARKLTICRLKHDVRPAFSLRGPESLSEVRSRNSLAIWWSIGENSRFLFV